MRAGAATQSNVEAGGCEHVGPYSDSLGVVNLGVQNPEVDGFRKFHYITDTVCLLTLHKCFWFVIKIKQMSCFKHDFCLLATSGIIRPL